MPGSDAAALDLSRVDGPHSPDRTRAAARLIADAVRFLNYASLTADNAPGIGGPQDVDGVLGALQTAAGGLQQTLSQLQHCLRDDLATHRLRLDAGRPHADDPATAVELACLALEMAKADCGADLREALAQARQYTAGMYLEEATDAR